MAKANKNKQAKTTERPMPVRWHAVISHIVNESMPISQAMIKAGLSESYANARGPGILMRDDRFCQALAAKRREIELQTGVSAEEWARQAYAEFQRLMRDDPTNARQYLDMYGKYIGVYERDNRQRQNNIGMVIM